MAGNHTTDVASPKNLPGDQKQKKKGMSTLHPWGPLAN